MKKVITRSQLRKVRSLVRRLWALLPEFEDRPWGDSTRVHLWGAHEPLRRLLAIYDDKEAR